MNSYEIDDLPFVDIEVTPGATHAMRPRLLLCVTTYNEPLAMVAATAASVCNSLQHARLARRRAGGDAALCLIVDGREPMASDLLRFLIDARLVTPQASLQDGRTRLFHARRIPSTLPWPEGYRCEDANEQMGFIVCIKGRNRGKLHSHALFFGRICAGLQPRVCFQLDAGTTVSPVAIGAMLEQFEREPNTGAIASRVTTPVATDGGLLEGWQYMDFATQAAVAWPAEILAGHLSVLPGQFSGLRWQALAAGRNPRTPCVDERALTTACATDPGDPLGRYLRGIVKRRPFERLMFLAEDRVIGNELVTASPRWNLGYCPEAHAVTDSCTTWPELLRQRRRWTNGSAACRLSLTARWPAEMNKPDRSARWKLRFTLAQIWQMLLVFQQCIAPATLACSLLLTAKAVDSALARGSFAVPGVLAAALAAGMAAALWRRPAFWRAPLRDAAFAIAFACLAILMAGVLPPLSLAALLLPPILATALTAAAEAPHHRTVLRRAVEYFVVVNPVVQSCLSAYAIARIADTSWGTKGLRQRSNGGRLLSLAAFAIWLACNSALVALALTTPPIVLPGLDPVLEATTLVFALSVTGALVLRGIRRRSSRAFPDLQGAAS
jgi:chitin synthase